MLTRTGTSREYAVAYLADTTRLAEIAPTTADTVQAAIQLVAAHKLQFWDAVILAAAAEADCGLLLSEDMQHGFTWRGVTILDPFKDPVDERLAALLAD